jgi:triacylglycerol lipase|tara:strand:- start:34033 stop:34779 length:747 start_codon:yes stop_codon:yes gene_type:complete
MPRFVKQIAWVLLYLTSVSASAYAARDVNCVVLLHGLARTHHAMSSIESTLKNHDYWVINQDYPSTKKSITELANQNIQPMVDACLNHHPDHIMFVTHSLGGIVLQKYLENHTIHNLSHIVMLSPPNHGSPLADVLHTNWFYKKIMGPAGQELTTDHPNNKPPLTHSYQIGIIAGNFNLIPFLNYLFHGDHDGKVSVSSARMEHTSDFIVLPVNHTFMMSNTRVKNQILHFLRLGRFQHQPEILKHCV